MKKILVMMLTFVLLVTGCSKSNKPNEEQKAAFTAAAERMANAKSADIDINVHMEPEKLEEGDEPVDVTMKMAFKTGKTVNDMDAVISMKMDEDPDNSFSIYKSGADLYMEIMDNKIKTNLGAISEFDELLELPTEFEKVASEDFDFDKSTVSVENGKTIFTYDLKEIIASDEFKEKIEQEESLDQVEITGGQVLITLGEEIEEFVFKFDMQAKEADEETKKKEKLKMDVAIKVNGIDDNVKIDFPSFDDYIDISTMY